MAKPKFDYDSEKFYEAIRKLATRGYKDAEIAQSLGDELGVDNNGKIFQILPQTFCEMKSGCYKGWTKEENERRGKRITEELARARDKITGIVRGTYLAAALGRHVVKGTVKRKRYQVINGIEDKDNYIMDETTSEQHTAPNMQALANWLYHHDPEFRRLQKGIEDGDIQITVKNGVDINKWLDFENSLENE